MTFVYIFFETKHVAEASFQKKVFTLDWKTLHVDPCIQGQYTKKNNLLLGQNKSVFKIKDGLSFFSKR